MRARRVALIAGSVVAAWFALLVILDFALGTRQERHTRERVGEALQAEVTLGDVDLALVRGHLAFDGLSATRDDAVGHLALSVDGVRCELAPLGGALFNRTCEELDLHGLRLEVSAAGLVKLQRPRKHAPIRADHVVLDQASLVFLPSALLPNVGQIEVALDHAEAGETVLRTPLSWLLSLQQLRAKLALPAGLTLILEYADGTLTASGSILGSKPVQLPVTLPVASAANDAHDEIKLLIDFATKTGERLIAKRASDWLRSKL